MSPVKKKPDRLESENPVEYYKRTRCCPDDYMEPHEGQFYCNPAHCSNVFADAETRNKHLSWAYSILD